ncbi:MAG: hypothetical protein Q9210_002202, partial [Variospora velana]
MRLNLLLLDHSTQGAQSAQPSTLSLSLAPTSMSDVSHFTIPFAMSHVVSAYRDGGAIVDRIKQKRLAKQAPPPTRLLEASLARGSTAVEEAKENGIERFGDRYAAGDSLAVNSLKDIVIDLQGSLIRHLRQAQEDDDMTDFTILVDASDIGRIRAVTVLNELYMRIAMGNTIAQAPFGDMGSFTNPRMASQYGHTLSNVSPQAAIGPPSQPSGDNHVEQPNLAHAETAGKQVGPQTSPRHGFLDRFRRKSSTEESSSPPSSRRSSHIRPRRDSSPSGRHDDKALPLTPMVLPRATIEEDNPWVTEGSEQIPIPQGPPPNKSISRATTLVPSIRRRTSTASSAWSATTASSAWSTSTSKARTISPFEVHKGFCKGAHKLQENEKDALKLQNRSDAKRVEDYYWACCSSKCAFAAHSTRLASSSSSTTTGGDLGNPQSVSREQSSVKSSRATQGGASSSPDTASVQQPVSERSSIPGEQDEGTPSHENVKQDPAKPAEEKRRSVERQGERPLGAEDG